MAAFFYDAVYSRMKKSGMENATIKLFSGARHDLLHEEKNGAEAARKLIAQWIGRCNRGALEEV